MVPNIKDENNNNNNRYYKLAKQEVKEEIKKDDYKLEIVWFNVALFIYLHISAYFGFMCVKTTIGIWVGWIFGLSGGFGITAGAHRLYAHRSYKANVPLRLILILFQTIACQNHMYEWVRDHRVHHKYTDTNADPHNSTRGFFFSHMGWLMCKKHPDVRAVGGKIDMSDLEADKIVMFQKKYYVPLTLFFSFGLPIGICYFCTDALFIDCLNGHIYRYLIQLHLTWLTNSWAHIIGSHPFEKDINPTDTYIIGILAFGEGWHNYHHVFPWDYKTSELGRWWCNFTIPFIDFFAWLGWATDLKTVSDEMIRKRVLRTGDGTHKYSKEQSGNNNQQENKVVEDVDHFWGWGDNDISEEFRRSVTIHNKTTDIYKMQ